MQHEMKHDIAVAAALAALLTACAPAQRTPSPAVPPLTPLMMPPPAAAQSAVDLVGPVWMWRMSDLAGGRRVAPSSPDRYTLEFHEDGGVALLADCNRGTARYQVGTDRRITITATATTKMACPRGSDDSEFLRELADASTIDFATGDLVLTLRDGTGAMRFVARPQ
jgi:heat shock protein HslJ